MTDAPPPNDPQDDPQDAHEAHRESSRRGRHRAVSGDADAPPTPLRDPVVLAAFEGWNDAGDAASEALRHLERVWPGGPIAELDPEEYYDFQVNRPRVSGQGSANDPRRITWPTTRLTWARPPGSDRDVLLVHGIEPSMRWRAYTADLLGRAQDLGAAMVITMGALLADVPHTRPIPVSSTSDDPQTLERLALQRSTYEGPTGIVGVVQDGATARGMTALSLWAAVPHYVGQAPSPKAVLALLQRIEEILDVTVDDGELVEDARAWERGVDELAREDGDIADYVAQLERAKDTSDLPEATGDAIARDFERYLRRRDDPSS